MINRLMFRPNLVDCILEERVAPAIANLATVILTTTGLTLIEGFPGANSSGAGSVGSNSGASSASSVSGVAMPTSFYVTGTGGISSLKPGNITGVPSLAAGATGAGGISLSIQVGSGADTERRDQRMAGRPITWSGAATVADPTANPTTITYRWHAKQQCLELAGAATGPKLPRHGAGRSLRLVEHGTAVSDRRARDEHRSVRSQPAGGRTDPRPVQYEPDGWHGQPNSRFSRARQPDDAGQQLTRAAQSDCSCMGPMSDIGSTWRAWSFCHRA